MAIKKTGSGESSRKGLAPGFRNTTIPKSYLFHKGKLYHTSFANKKPVKESIFVAPGSSIINTIRNIKNFRILARINEKDAQAFLKTAETKKNQGDYSIAFGLLNKGLQCNPWSYQLHYLRADLLEASGHKFEALSAFILAKKLKKYNSVPYHKRIFLTDPLTEVQTAKWNFIPNDNLENSGNNSTNFFSKISVAASLIWLLPILGSSAKESDNKKQLLTEIALYENSQRTTADVAELELILKDKSGRDLSGTVTITGDTTINDNVFQSPKTYVLKNITGIDDTRLDELRIGPNPTNFGQTNLFTDGLLQGKIQAYSLDNKLLGSSDLSKDNNLAFSSSPGVIIIHYQNGTSNKTFKVLNNNRNFVMDFVLGDPYPVTSGKLKIPGVSKGNTADEYTISFLEQNSNVESFSESFVITPGNIHTIDTVLDWTEKTIFYRLNTNTNSTIKIVKASDGTVLDEKTSASGTLATQTLNQRFDAATGIQLEYFLTAPFTDTVKYVRTQLKDEEFVIDTLRNGWFYPTITGNGSSYVVKKDGETIISSTPVGTESLFKLQGDLASVVFEVSGEGLISKSVPATFSKGKYSQAITLEELPPETYNHSVAVSLASSRAADGKKIIDGTRIYKVTAPAFLDTVWVNSSNYQALFNWTDNNPTTTIKIGALSVVGHAPAEITINADNSENGTVTFTANPAPSLAHNVHVQNQTDENVTNVSIAGGDAVVVTNTSGVATVAKSNLPTDEYNRPLSSYVTNLVLTASNIQTLNTSITSIVGTNPEALKQVNQVYTHLVTGQFLSGKAGKEIIDGTRAYLAKGDTLWHNTAEQNFSFSWTDLNKTVNTRVGARTVAGHVPNYVERTIDDSESFNIIFTGLNYSLTQSVIVKDQFSSAVADATVTGGDTPVQTIVDGTATYTRNNLETDINNLPFASYPAAVSVSKTGYQTLNTNISSMVGTNPQHQIDVVKESTIHSFTWVVKDIHGDIVTDLTQKIEWNGDGHVQYVTPDANGIINIFREETGTPSTKLKVSNTSVKYSDFQVWRDWSRPVEEVLRDTNYCQIQNFATSKFAELNLTGVPSELTQYVAKEKLKTPPNAVATYGDSISIYHPVVRDMMGGRLAGATTKFVSTPTQPAVEAVRFTMNYNTGAPISQENLNRQIMVWNNVQNIYTLSDGKKLINISNFVLNSRTDPKWMEIIARGYKNCVRTYFYDSTPSNNVFLTLSESPNGNPIFNDSFGRYPELASLGDMLEEKYQSLTNNADPPSGNTIQFVHDGAGGVNEFGKTMARLIYHFNPGTPTF